MLTIKERNTQVDVVCPNCGKSRKVIMDTMRRWAEINSPLTIDDYKKVPCRKCKYLLQGKKIRNLENHKIYDVKCPKCGVIRHIKSQTIYGWLLRHPKSEVPDYFNQSLCRDCVGLNASGEVSSDGGYTTILLDKNDPFIELGVDSHRKNGKRRCLKHRYLMAKMLDRVLEEWEVVHHKDANKSNNPPD